MSFIDWLSDKNNYKLNKSEYLYGTRHLIVLGIVVIATILLSLILTKKDEKVKTIFFRVCGCILLFVEILQRIIKLSFSQNITLNYFMLKILPLYFCSITVCVMSVALIINNKTLINALTIMGVLVTTSYLLFPATGLNKAYLTFDALYSISSHAFGFVICMLLIITRYAKFDFKQIWKTFIVFAIVVVYGIIMSLVVFPNTEDYVFILTNPLEFDTAIPYQIIYVVFLCGFISLFYLCEFICKKVKLKKQKTIQ